MILSNKFSGRFKKALSLLLCGALLFCLAGAPAMAQSAEDEVQIDAEEITYVDATGVVIAKGSVKASSRNMHLFAPYAEYNAQKETLIARSDEDEPVTMLMDDKKMMGRTLEYDIAARKGLLTEASGQMNEIYFKGDDLDVMPLEEAAREKIVSAGLTHGSLKDVMLARWKNVSATTCDFPEPHYRLVTKQATIVPGQRVVIKKPRVYLGKRLIFTYPFDHVVPLSEGGEAKNRSFFMPRVTYSSTKGVGASLGGPLTWGSGEVDLYGVYWSKNIFEFRFGVTQHLSDEFSIFAITEKSYNKIKDESVWRPNWGIDYASRSGWSARLWESQRELYRVEMIPGEEKYYNLWRSPEFRFSSPWFLIKGPDIYAKIHGKYGRYQDNAEPASLWIKRAAAGMQLYSEPKLDLGDFKPFYNLTYWYYDYDGGDANQRVFDMIAGFQWRIGDVKLGTAYSRRWVDGKSPMLWDRYSPREDIYQKISFSIPGKRDWETWDISVMADYDLKRSRLASMVYSLGYNMHCVKWELWVRDYRADNDLSVSLRFTVNAYPYNPLEIGVGEIYDPFKSPVTEKKKENNK